MKKANLAANFTLTALALLTWIGTAPYAQQNFVVPTAYLVGSMLTLAACLSWVLLNSSPCRLDDETRCPKCGERT